MENSANPWTHHAQNWWIGCTKVRDACDNCYAWFQEDVRYKGRRALWGDHPRYRTTPAYWKRPLKWNREAAAVGRSLRVFTNSLSDFFHNQVDPQWRADAWVMIKRCEYVDWLILTKRPQNIRKMLPANWGAGWPNVWLGSTVENMTEARRRIPLLLRVPAFVHFLSCEPLLARLDLRPWLGKGGRVTARSMRGCQVAFFMKQMTARFPKEGEALIPADLMIRKFPEAA